MGTTRMGDKVDSVVDKDCRTYDHQNLVILGSSVFPTGSTGKSDVDHRSAGATRGGRD